MNKDTILEQAKRISYLEAEIEFKDIEIKYFKIYREKAEQIVEDLRNQIEMLTRRVDELESK